MKLQIAAAATATLVSVLLIGSAAAQNGNPITVEGHPVAYVSHSDLNLRNQNGLDTLNRRVARAAERVCGISRAEAHQPLKLRMDERTCFAFAVTSAQSQIKSAIESPEFAERNPRIVLSINR